MKNPDIIKKILYKARYRGSKEVDNIMINFIQGHTQKYDDQSLNLLANFLDQDDLVLFNCVNIPHRNQVEIDFLQYLIDIQWFNGKVS